MAFSVKTATKRAEMMARIRSFFARRNVLEVETPVLSRTAITDCYIDLFNTVYHPCGTHTAIDTETFFLQSSPELFMKRLLAAGFPDIFQISKVFRNGECGRLHNPEFTMLEWYRLGFDMYRLIDEVAALLSDLFGEVKVTRIAYKELFERFTGIDPLAASMQDVAAFLKEKEMEVPDCVDQSDTLRFTMSMYIEPKLPQDELIVVFNYPREQAVLSVIDCEDNRVARRFECYYRGMELANGFEELTDHNENARRVRDEVRRRKERGRTDGTPSIDFDPSVISGLPACSGVAVGLDRVLLCCLEGTDISSVMSFDWNNC